jgi:hypothetical protein
MSSALPALLLFNKRVFVRSKMGFPSLSYWYLVLRAEPMTCSGGTPYTCCLSGQGKSGHAWSLQNRPYGMARDVVLFILLSPDQASLFWFSSFAVRILGCDRGGEDDPAWQ